MTSKMKLMTSRPVAFTTLLLLVIIMIAPGAYADKSGKVTLHLLLPHLNSFVLRPEGEETKVNSGFWGVGVGVSFYHSQSQYLLLSVNGVTDFFLPVPAAVDIVSDWESMSSMYVSVSNHHELGKLELGYGLWLGRNYWQYNTGLEPRRDQASDRSGSFGFVLPIDYQLSRATYLGLKYRPGIVRFGSQTKALYEHLLSIQLAWRISL